MIKTKISSHGDSVLRKIAVHPYYKKATNRFKDSEWNIIYQFAMKFEHKDLNEFEALVNRMYIDKEEKPKHLGLIQEILSVFNKMRYENG